MPSLGSRQDARDSGNVLIGELTSLVLTGLMLASLLGVMWLSVRLVRTTPPAHNPTVYGTLVASGAELGDSLVPLLLCTNPNTTPRENSRTNCLTVEPEQLSPVVDPAAADRSDVGRDAMCWLVVNDRVQTADDKRRLECWQLLDSGYLQVWVHEHNETDGVNPLNDLDGDSVIDLDVDGNPVSGTSDLLRIQDWKTSPSVEHSHSIASGLRAMKWQCPTDVDDYAECSVGVATSTVELIACASIKPEQRNLMKDGFVPFCDGTIGMELSNGAARPAPSLGDWTSIEGYLLPPVYVYESNA